MIEIFTYTERVVNMVRPRKLLFMAIGEFPLRLPRTVTHAPQMASHRAPR